MSEDIKLPADLLAEIDADVARYRAMRIRAAQKRICLAQNKKFIYVEITIDDQVTIVRRFLAGDSKASISKSLGWPLSAVGRAMDYFRYNFLPEDHPIDWFNESQRDIIARALVRFDNDPMPNLGRIPTPVRQIPI
jgi:hypothetical protein